MRLSSRVKLMSTIGLLLVVAASLTLFGATRGISHASGTLHQASTQAGSTAATTTSSCGSWHIVPVQYPPMGNGNFGFDGIIAFSPNNVWAVGDFIEHWNGTKWSVVGPNLGLNGIAALSANNIWAVGGGVNADGNSHVGGNGLVEHWNGTHWSSVPGANLGSTYTYLNAVAAISANNIWTVGGDGNGPLIEHWNGSHWSAIKSPSQNLQYYELTGISVVSANDIWTVGGYAYGYFTGAPFKQTLIEHWDGKVWSIISSPNPLIFNYLYGVTAVSANNVWAVGETTDNSVDEALIEHWDGTKWSVVPGPNLGSSNFPISLNGVIAISANNIWAVGSYSNGGLTEHWNGSSWSIVKSGKLPGSSLWAVAGVPHTNTLWAVGTNWPPGGDYSNVLTEFYC